MACAVEVYDTVTNVCNFRKTSPLNTTVTRIHYRKKKSVSFYFYNKRHDGSFTINLHISKQVKGDTVNIISYRTKLSQQSGPTNG